MADLKITNKTGNIHDTKVLIDGLEIKGLVSIKMNIDASAKLEATAVFKIDTIDIESKVIKGMETAYLYGDKKDAE